MEQYFLAVILGTTMSVVSIFAVTTVNRLGSDRSHLLEPVSFIDHPPSLSLNLSNILTAYNDTDSAITTLTVAQARTKSRYANVDEINTFMEDSTFNKVGLREVAVECRRTYCIAMIDADASHGEWL